MSVLIRKVKSAEELEMVRELFTEYAKSVDLDLSTQAFDEELQNLPGAYCSPSGCLLLASWGDKAAGCVALRPLEEEVCEMKRLYVRPPYRTAGLGRTLITQLILEARQMNYRLMRLDTIPMSMGSAVRLYEEFGFKRIAPYRNNPLPGVEYMELLLKQPGSDGTGKP